MAWSTSGIDDTGAITDGDGATVRFYCTVLRPGPQSATFGLLGPPDKAATWRIDVAGSHPVSGSVLAGQASTVTAGLPRLAERGAIDVRVSGAGVRVAGIVVGPRC
jgi:hypothetical protein